MKKESVKKSNIVRLTVFKRFSLRFILAAAIFLLCQPSKLPANDSFMDDLRRGFSDPPQEAGVRCWWWWLNSNVTKEAITRDLEEMKAKGFSGAMIFDAGGADLRGNAPVPAGPLYGSRKWRGLYKHALKEAGRLGLVLGLSIQSGWNLGGPNVTPDFAAKQVVWSEIRIEGPVEYNHKLPTGFIREGFYRDIVVLAYKNKDLIPQKSKPIQYLRLKSGTKELGYSAPDCRYLLNDYPSVPGEEDVSAKDVVDITDNMAADGTLRWSVPEGGWTVLRFGYTVTNAHVSTYSGQWKGYVLDYLSR